MTASERANEMLNLPMRQLPELAKEYARNICNREGNCNTGIFVEAYTTYCILEEGLPCESYHPSETEQEIFFKIKEKLSGQV